jgi:hypothetical protein
MPTPPAIPLDYATRSAVAAVDTLLVSKALPPGDAQRLREAITTAYYEQHAPPAPRVPDMPRTALPTPRTARPEVSVGQAAAAVEKQAPPSPPSSAPDTFLTAIAKRQAAQPALSFRQASDAVHTECPELYAQYQRDARYPHLIGQPMPVAKAAPLTYEAILALADARVAKAAGLSRRDALIALVQEHPSEQAYHEAYRKYHLTDGLAEHRAAGVATSTMGTAS